VLQQGRATHGYQEEEARAGPPLRREARFSSASKARRRPGSAAAARGRRGRPPGRGNPKEQGRAAQPLGPGFSTLRESGEAADASSPTSRPQPVLLSSTRVAIHRGRPGPSFLAVSGDVPPRQCRRFRCGATVRPGGCGGGGAARGGEGGGARPPRAAASVPGQGAGGGPGRAAAAAGDVGAVEAELREARRLHDEARQRRFCLAGGLAALVAVAIAVVTALVLERRGGSGGENLLLQIAANLPAW